MYRIILHCDLNNFFASATLTQNATLKGFPVAVCGDTEKRHGIVLAKNEMAKSYGIKTAETVWQAKEKCPELITVPPNFKLYEKLSLAARSIYCQYTNRVECFGIDECWLELSEAGRDFDLAEKIANDIRRRMKREVGLTISCGVSFSKYFSKLGSDLKKPDAVTRIDPFNYRQIVWPLPCSALLMVGPKTQKALNAAGIFTIGDLANAPENFIQTKLGINGLKLKKAAQGQEVDGVTDFKKKPLPKSVSRSATTEQDLTTFAQVKVALLGFAEQVAAQLRQTGQLAGTVGVTAVTNDFKGHEWQAPLQVLTNNSTLLAKAAFQLFQKFYFFEKPLRSVGLRVSSLKLEAETGQQLSLFQNTAELENLQKVETSVFHIREKYGETAIMRAACLYFNHSMPLYDFSDT